MQLPIQAGNMEEGTRTSPNLGRWRLREGWNRRTSYERDGGADEHLLRRITGASMADWPDAPTRQAHRIGATPTERRTGLDARLTGPSTTVCLSLPESRECGLKLRFAPLFVRRQTQNRCRPGMRAQNEVTDYVPNHAGITVRDSCDLHPSGLKSRRRDRTERSGWETVFSQTVGASQAISPTPRLLLVAQPTGPTVTGLVRLDCLLVSGTGAHRIHWRGKERQKCLKLDSGPRLSLNLRPMARTPVRIRENASWTRNQAAWIRKENQARKDASHGLCMCLMGARESPDGLHSSSSDTGCSEDTV